MACKWQVEIDPNCRKELAKHWPDVERFEDVRECGQENLENVDLICGGFPCQPVSVAGKQQGQDDERWLWPEFHRLIREIRPRWVLAENVPGLLANDAGRLYGTVLRDLAEGGYDAEWDCIPAGAFGAHFRGDRVFIVASSSPTSSLRRQGKWANPSRAFAGHEFTRLVERELQVCVPAGKGDRVSDGLPRRLDRLRGLGNAVVPQVAEWIGRRIMKAQTEASTLDAQQAGG